MNGLSEKDVRQATRRAAEEWLETKLRPAILENMSGKVLKTRTGRTKNAVSVRSTETSKGVEGLVGASTKEAAKVLRIWELTGHPEIRPQAGRPYSSGEYPVLPASDPRARLRFRIGGPVSGRHVFVKRVKAEKPRPVIQPAIQAQMPNYRPIAARYYRKAIIGTLARKR